MPVEQNGSEILLRIAVVNDQGQVQLAGKLQLRQKDRFLLRRRGIIPIIVQPKFPHSNHTGLRGKRRKLREAVGIDLCRIGGVDPDG